MATQTTNGLMVPVIRDAESRERVELAREILRLADAARTGKATREELTGSTITLSSLGPMGGVTSTPVINRPEVAIIAVNKVREMPVIVDGELEARKLMNLSLVLRPPGGRRLGRGQLHAGPEGADREPAEIAFEALRAAPQITVKSCAARGVIPSESRKNTASPAPLPSAS